MNLFDIFCFCPVLHDFYSWACYLLISLSGWYLKAQCSARSQLWHGWIPIPPRAAWEYFHSALWHPVFVLCYTLGALCCLCPSSPQTSTPGYSAYKYLGTPLYCFLLAVPWHVHSSHLSSLKVLCLLGPLRSLFSSQVPHFRVVRKLPQGRKLLCFLSFKHQTTAIVQFLKKVFPLICPGLELFLVREQFQYHLIHHSPKWKFNTQNIFMHKWMNLTLPS